MIEALNKVFLCRLFSVSSKQDASDYEQNTPEYTCQRIDPVFFPENWTDFLFQELPKEIQSKIVYIYSEMFTPRYLDTNDQILNTAHDA